MNHHLEAWNKVKPHLFGSVLEVSRKTPWGFKEDKSDIENVDVKTYLSNAYKTDTIILHILSGEKEPKKNVEEVVKKALKECVKLVILEHNPDEWDVKKLDFIEKLLPKGYITNNWGRNLLFATTTTKLLQLPYLSDEYIKEHLPKTHVTSIDEGIDKDLLVYTHTSESKVIFELPKGTIYWVIGGGLPYETIEAKNNNIFIDSVLRQVVYCAYLYGDEKWKLKRIWNDVDKVNTVEDHRQWRVVTKNNVKPKAILHISLTELHTEDLVYISTVDKKYWGHLPNVIDAYTERDVPKLVMV